MAGIPGTSPRRMLPPGKQYCQDLVSDLKRLVKALEAGQIVLSEVLVGPVGLSHYSVTVTPRLMGWTPGRTRIP